MDGTNVVLVANGIYFMWMRWDQFPCCFFLPGSDLWTAEEKESFEKAFQTYGKDFHLIQKQVSQSSYAVASQVIRRKC